MEATYSDRWSRDTQKIPRKTPAISRRKAFTILAGMGLFALGTAFSFVLMSPTSADAKSQSLKTQGKVANLTRIERNMTVLTNRVTQLEQANASLGQEVGLLTSRNGVLSGIIQQIRSIKGETQYMRRDVFGAVEEQPSLREDMAAGGDLSNASIAAPRARHFIVTPRSKSASQPANKDPETIK